MKNINSMSDAAQLLTRILRFLEIRPRSEYEVRTRLSRYGSTDEQTTAIINKLHSLKFLDDQTFVRYLVDSRRSQGRSTRIIASELARHGIPREQIVSSLGGIAQDRATLKKLVVRKSHLPREKLLTYLARRGFAWDLIREALSGYNDSINRNS